MGISGFSEVIPLTTSGAISPSMIPQVRKSGLGAPGRLAAVLEYKKLTAA